MLRTTTWRSRLGGAAVLGALLAIAPSAQAADPSRQTDCTPTSKPFEQVFLRAPWFDPASYTLSPGGDMESTLTDWTLSGGAAVIDGNESYQVGAGGQRSLALPSGSTTTSAPICVALDYPHMRFFMRNTGAASGRLKVEVRTVTALGIVTSLLPTTLSASSSWELSPPVLLVANVGALLSRGGVTPVSFRFTPVGGAWQIDDVWVDPYRSR